MERAKERFFSEGALARAPIWRGVDAPEEEQQQRVLRQRNLWRCAKVKAASALSRSLCRESAKKASLATRHMQSMATEGGPGKIPLREKKNEFRGEMETHESIE